MRVTQYMQLSIDKCIKCILLCEGCMTCFITWQHVQPHAIFRGVWALSTRITESVTSWALSVQNHRVSCICGTECSESLSQLHLGH